MQGEMRGRRFCVEQHACYPYPIPIFPLPFLFCNVCRFIGVWQQMSSQRPQRENGATVRASGVIQGEKNVAHTLMTHSDSQRGEL